MNGVPLPWSRYNRVKFEVKGVDREETEGPGERRRPLTVGEKDTDKVRERETERKEKEIGSVLHLSADSCLPCEARPAPGRSSCFSHTPHRQ